MKIVNLIALMMCMFSTCSRQPGPFNKKVYLTVIARDNKAHLLPGFLKCIDDLDYKKELIDVQIICGNSDDTSYEVIKAWENTNKKKYHKIRVDLLASSKFKQMRNESLRLAKETKCEYYFALDASNFVAPWTLRTLIEKDKPIIAPLLGNDFSEPADEGCFKVSILHDAYLIKKDYLPLLTYQDETSDDECVIFSRSARDQGVDQYICNEQDFGVQWNEFADTL